ncbi:MAG: aspartate dehydrogenase domain-containing protein, partial [Stackebrandtia sp.]
MRVAVIGRGAVGSVVARSIRDDNVPGAELAGVIARSGPSGRPDTDDLPMITLHEALRESDLVVECANQQVVKDVGARI